MSVARLQTDYLMYHGELRKQPPSVYLVIPVVGANTAYMRGMRLCIHPYTQVSYMTEDGTPLRSPTTKDQAAAVLGVRQLMAHSADGLLQRPQGVRSAFGLCEHTADTRAAVGVSIAPVRIVVLVQHKAGHGVPCLASGASLLLLA